MKTLLGWIVSVSLVSPCYADRRDATHDTVKTGKNRPANARGPLPQPAPGLPPGVEAVPVPANGANREAQVAVINNAKGECPIAPGAAPPQVAMEKPVRTLILRGGGFEPNMDQFLATLKATGDKRRPALILSATRTGNRQSPVETGNVLNFYKKMGVDPTPIFTRAQGDFVNPASLGGLRGLNQSANSQANVKKIQESSAVVISGGYPPELVHLGDTKVAAAVREAYLAGKPIYGNSAALSILGSVYTWKIPNNKPTTAMGVLDVALLSHAKDLNNVKDMNLLVPKVKPVGLALTTETDVKVENEVLTVLRGDPAQHRVYIFDPAHHPATATPACDTWYIVPGQHYDLKTGRVW